MSIVVSRDAHGYVNLRHSRWAAAEPTRGVFTMTADEWEDLRRWVARDEIERLRRLPRTLPLEDTLSERFVLTRVVLDSPAGGAV